MLVDRRMNHDKEHCCSTRGAGDIGQAVVIKQAQTRFCACILDQNEKAGHELASSCANTTMRVFHGLEYGADEIKEVCEIYAKHRRIDVLVNLGGGTIHNHAIMSFRSRSG